MENVSWLSPVSGGPYFILIFAGKDLKDLAAIFKIYHYFLMVVSRIYMGFYLDKICWL